MKKGITPVIAVVLLLMITIAMVGFAYVWFTRLMSTTTGAVSNQSEQQIAQMGQTIRIDNAKSTQILLRNSGTQTIPAGQVSVLGITGTCTVPELGPGATHTCTNACTAGNTITASAPGNVDQAVCTS